MAKRRVASSNLQTVDYDPVAKQLTVTFKSQAVYRYAGVGKRKVTDLLKAKSKGRFLLDRIVPLYDATRIRKWRTRK